MSDALVLGWSGRVIATLSWMVLWGGSVLLGQGALTNTAPLTLAGDLPEQMVAGIDRFFSRALEAAPAQRPGRWRRDLSGPAAYETSVQPNRERLRRLLGVVDARLPVSAGAPQGRAQIAETDLFTVETVRWPVFEGVWGEGLWLRPKGSTVARVVALPDADQTPEMLVGLTPGTEPEHQFARRLVEHGCEVLIPVLIDRQDTWSGSAALRRFTNQPHREWIYRQAYVLGRHIIGFEVQKILAAVDFLTARSPTTNAASPQAASPLPVGVAGYAEGGLLAFYAAALDRRIEAALVSGYFDARERVWEEPIYRNLFGLLREFGDAEIATLIAPRVLIVEHSPVPNIDGPPTARPGRSGAAPGKLNTPDYETVESEYDRARTLLQAGAPKYFDRFKLISGAEGMTTGPGSDRALTAFLDALGLHLQHAQPPGPAPRDCRPAFDPAERQERLLQELEQFTQKLALDSSRVRAAAFWDPLDAKTPEAWTAACRPFKQRFIEEILGPAPAPALPLNPRTRALEMTAASASTNTAAGPAATPSRKWTGYEVMLDVGPDLFAWGYLLVPVDIPAGERRPVVVCQHGLEGTPADVISQDPNREAFRFYQGFGARLAEEGFVVFAPQNPYRGQERFRQLQRKANPLGMTLFSIITAQHARLLEWLGTLPFVDAKRIGFYGLSYGGTTALRVPAALEGYALSICSGNFNDWVRKTTTVDSPTSYLFTGEYEMPEFNLGPTFSHAEMAALIAPRPFMVERGHHDPVGIDEWVSAEYAKVLRLYEHLGITDRTRIEFFDGGHAIHGVGTFEFLRQHLGWPKP